MRRKVPIDARIQRLSSINPETGCWDWNGYKQEFGYGRVALNGKAVAAHRASYETFVGPIPAGMNVLHKCDNRGCVNPDHLYAGTDSDNMMDMYSRNRHPRGSGLIGESHPIAKLTETQVREIRALGLGPSETSRKFGISKGYAWSVINGITWRHVK